jgi:FkbM family methyltransferase
MLDNEKKRFELEAGITGRKYYGLNQLDIKMEKYLDYENGTFIELGANDGQTQSNTKYYEDFRGWSGMLIEPSPNNYKNCIKNRSVSNHIFNCACVPFHYEKDTIDLFYSNLMTAAAGLVSDIREASLHAEGGSRFLKEDEKVERFTAKARTLNSLLEEVSFPTEIDFLSLDVEGVEIEVLKGVDFDKYKFKYMLIECRSIDALTEFLAEKEFRLIDQLSFHDYLFTSIK